MSSKDTIDIALAEVKGPVTTLLKAIAVDDVVQVHCHDDTIRAWLGAYEHLYPNAQLGVSTDDDIFFIGDTLYRGSISNPIGQQRLKYKGGWCLMLKEEPGPELYPSLRLGGMPSTQQMAFSIYRGEWGNSDTHSVENVMASSCEEHLANYKAMVARLEEWTAKHKPFGPGADPYDTQLPGWYYAVGCGINRYHADFIDDDDADPLDLSQARQLIDARREAWTNSDECKARAKEFEASLPRRGRQNKKGKSKRKVQRRVKI